MKTAEEIDKFFKTKGYKDYQDFLNHFEENPSAYNLDELITEHTSQQLAERDETIEALQDQVRDKTIERDKALKQVQSLKEEVEGLKDELEKAKKSSKEWCDKAMEKHEHYRKSQSTITTQVEDIKRLKEGMINGKYILSTDEPKPNDLVYSLVSKRVVTFTDPRFFSESTYLKVNLLTPKQEESKEGEVFKQCDSCNTSKCSNLNRCLK